MTLNEKIDALTQKYQALSDKLDAMTPASALAKLSHAKPPSPARKKASSENGKKGGRPAGLWVGNKFIHRPVVSLYRIDGEWILETYHGDIIPSKSFPTAKEARAFAESKNWGVKRLPDCDS